MLSSLMTLSTYDIAMTSLLLSSLEDLSLDNGMIYCEISTILTGLPPLIKFIFMTTVA